MCSSLSLPEGWGGSLDHALEAPSRHSEFPSILSEVGFLHLLNCSFQWQNEARDTMSSVKNQWGYQVVKHGLAKPVII